MGCGFSITGSSSSSSIVEHAALNKKKKIARKRDLEKEVDRIFIGIIMIQNFYRCLQVESLQDGGFVKLFLAWVLHNT